jgi:hypothetical protein
VTAESVQALAHEATSSNELWQRRLGHLHYKALPDLQNLVCCMPSISLSKNEICKGCMLGKNIKKSFPSSDSRARGILMYMVPCHLLHSMDVLYIFMSLRKRGQRWNPRAKKGFLWGTMRTSRLTGLLYQVRGK